MAEAEQLTSELRGKLRRLRAALRGRLAGEGLAWLLIALVAGVFATLAADYTLHMERPLRAILACAVLAVLAWIAWRFLASPLLVAMPAEDLALLIERRHRKLGDRLISAIQFSRRRDDLGQSGAMIRHVVREACELAAGLDLAGIVESRRLWRVLGASFAAAVLLGGFAAWQRDVMALWLQRNVALADVDWPQKTYLRVAGGPDFKVLRGDDLEIVIRAEDSEVIPPYVILHALYPSVGEMTEERVDLAAEGGRSYVKRFASVTEEFGFYVTGGDDRSDRRRPHRIRLIDPPALSRLRFVLEYPGYMNRPPRQVEGFRGVLVVPAGSNVQVTAEATKDLESARILLDGQEVDTARIEPLAQGGAGEARLRGIVGRFQITAPSGAKKKRGARTLQFALIDTAGYTNRGGQKFTIEIQTDRAPSVDLSKRAVREIVTPQATIPLLIRAEDDFGIASAKATLAAKGKKPVKPAEVVAVASAGGRKLLTAHEMDLRPYGLKPGDVVGIRVEVSDTLPGDLGGPNAGRAGPLTFRIVKPGDLMTELVRRQKALRLEFVQAIALQESARGKMQAAAGDLGGAAAGGQVPPEVRRKLGESAQEQASVAAECAKSADSFLAVLEEMTYNRLGSAEGRGQLRAGIIEPLKALAEPIKKVVAALNQAAAAADAAQLPQQAATILEVQEGIVQQMQAILERMQKLESRQDMINTLNMIIRWSEQQLKGIEKKSDSEVEVIFDDKVKPKAKPK